MDAQLMIVLAALGVVLLLILILMVAVSAVVRARMRRKDEKNRIGVKTPISMISRAFR